MTILNEKSIKEYEDYLTLQEKSPATIKKYSHTMQMLQKYMIDQNMETDVTKKAILQYRDFLKDHLKPQTVNGILSAVNTYLDYCNVPDRKVKLLKVQQQIFIDEEKELNGSEYKRLLKAADKKGNRRLYMVMLTIGNTGIRISELRYITVDAVKKGRAEVYLKAKKRVIIISKQLKRQLLEYAREKGIIKGELFCTKTGKSLDRSNIYHEMKKLCEDAKVNPKKIFPHNLRHLFARTFYAMEKNIVYLANILGHSRLETTRIYTAASVRTHERIINKMGLIT